MSLKRQRPTGLIKTMTRLFGLAVGCLLAGAATAAPIGGGGLSPQQCSPATRPLFACRKGPVTCEAGQWVPGLPLPAGTPCLNASGGRGTCSTSQVCVAVPAGPSGNFSPQYILLALTYAPPGDESSVLYTSGNGVGTVDNISHALGAGVTVQNSGEGFYFSVGWSLTTQYGDQYTFTRTESEGLGTLPNPTVNPAADPVDHKQDTFWLWIKPQMHYVQKYKDVPNISMNFIAPDKGIVAQPITVAQLLGLAPDINGVMNGWTAADKANLLKQDPFLSNTYKIDPKRYTFNREVLLLGPLSPGGAIPTEPVTITYTGQDCKSVQVQEQSTVSLGVTASVSFFITEQLQVYGTLTSTETASTATCDQLMQTLQWTPASAATGYSHLIDVYVDNLFGTLAFIDEGTTSSASPDSVTVSGTVLGSDGKGASYQQVDLLLSNGRLRTLLSDKNGSFKTSVPAGTTTIRTNATEKQFLASRGSVVVDDLHAISLRSAPKQ